MPEISSWTYADGVKGSSFINTHWWGQGINYWNRQTEDCSAGHFKSKSVNGTLKIVRKLFCICAVGQRSTVAQIVKTLEENGR